MGALSALLAPLWAESTGDRWIPLTKASDEDLDIFFDLRLDKRFSEMLVIWDAIALLMTSF